MEIETTKGTFNVTETATGLMAENMESHERLFLEGRFMPHSDCTMDFSLLIAVIEDEVEFQEKYN